MDAFRKIDIDQYEEDVLLEEELYEPDPRDPATILNETKQKATTVRGSLSRCVGRIRSVAIIKLNLYYRGDIAGALSLVLDGPPYGPNVEEAKVCPSRSGCARSLMPMIPTEFEFADVGVNLEQHEEHRDP